MKITCIIASLRMGGAERQLTGLATLLKQNGEDVDVLTYRSGDFYTSSLQAAGVRHTCLDWKGPDVGLIRRIAAHLKDNGTQVVISFLVGANIKACLAHIIYPGFKLVVSERNCNTSLLPHDRFRFILYRTQADAVVCNSFAQTAFLSRHCPGLRLKVETIPNFVDFGQFYPSKEDRKREGPLNVVTVARLSPRKNAMGLLRAATDPSLGNIRFHWYGVPRGSRYEKRCREFIKRKGLQDRFIMHPAIDNPAEVYRQADAFCLCSFYEGTPNSLAEALCCGLPAICSNVSDNARYVIPGRNGFLFNPHESRSIVKALRKLSALTPEQFKECSAESLEIASDNFPTHLFLKRYVDLLGGIERKP
ncbi:MAG: glycosyltransferase [Bacteroidales bacterium]|nr:glycosyltransferase [Bacteroidales bacterium]